MDMLALLKWTLMIQCLSFLMHNETYFRLDKNYFLFVTIEWESQTWKLLIAY